MRLNVCVCVYFLVLFTFVNCDETEKVSNVTTAGTVQAINPNESASTEQQTTVTTDKSLLPTTTKKTEIPTTENTTNIAAPQNSRSAVGTTSRQMYVSNCPCSCDQSGDSLSSYSVPQQQSVLHSSYLKPTSYEAHPQQASYAQSSYPSQTSSYQSSYNVPLPSYQPQYEYSVAQRDYAAQNYPPQYYRSNFNAWEENPMTDVDPVFRSYEPSPQHFASHSDCGSNQMIECAPTVNYVPCSSYGSPSY